MKVMKFVRSSSFQQLLARRTNVGVSITVNMRTAYGNVVLASNVEDCASLTFSPKGGLDGFPLRVSNEGLPRPRVARAQETV